MCQEPQINPIVPDDSSDSFGDGNDSSFEDGYQTDTTSVTSSIYDFRYENGRRYHNYRSQQYHLPNDESEQDRLDRWHHIEGLINHGKLTDAPIEKPTLQRILDVGTGTGLWAMDAADTWPQAEVLGVDITPIQPSWVPPNCKFEVDDLEQEWTFPRDYFDFVHCRYMIGSIGDWSSFFKNVFRHTKPGGYLEVTEQVLEMYSKASTGVPKDLQEYFKNLNAAATSVGKPMLGVIEKFREFLQDAGFELVSHKVDEIPVCTWAKENRMKMIGACTQDVHNDGFEAYGLALYTEGLGWAAPEAKTFFTKLREELNRKNQLFTYRHNIVARKPGGTD